MTLSSDPYDFVTAVQEAKGHVVERAIFWPARWKEFRRPRRQRWDWKSVPFNRASAKDVPNDQHGVYSFILCPSVAAHPKNHFVLYVGKADTMTLRARFRSYFDDMKRVKRPKICFALNMWDGYLEFCFTTVRHPADIVTVESRMLDALLPPYNTQFSGRVSKIIRGLR